MISFCLAIALLVLIAAISKPQPKRGKALRKRLYHLRINHPGKTERWYWYHAQKRR